MNLSPNSRVSGQPVTVSGEAVFISGTVSIVSGAYVNVGSGLGVVAASGLYIVSDSGQRVVIQSGASVSLQSGLQVNIGSGVGVTIQSGIYVNTGVASSSISGQAVYISGTVSLLSGGYVNIGSGIGVIENPANLSGLFTAAVSGIGYTIGGINRALFSGVNTIIASGQLSYVTIDTDGSLIVDIDKTDSSGLGVMTSISGNAVYVSGTVALLSGGYVTATIGSVSISGQAVFISGTISLLSGGYVNIGSGIGIVQASGAYIINDSGVRVVIQSGASVSIQSGTFINIGSGIGVTVDDQTISGLYVQTTSGSPVWVSMMSGNNFKLSGLSVIISGQPVSISGQAVFVSGTIALLSGGYVNIGSGVGIVLNPAYISGQYIANTASSPLYVQSGQYVNIGGATITANISGQAVTLASGAFIFVSGNTAQMVSGQALFVQMSGVITQMSGQTTTSQPMGYITGSASMVRIGSSGTQFPNIACDQITVTQAISNVLWIGTTAASANSGVGFMWSTTGVDSRQTMVFPVLNANQLWMKAQVTSTPVYFIAY